MTIKKAIIDICGKKLSLYSVMLPPRIAQKLTNKLTLSNAFFQAFKLALVEASSNHYLHRPWIYKCGELLGEMAMVDHHFYRLTIDLVILWYEKLGVLLRHPVQRALAVEKKT
jgi:hypothetical protein